MNIYPKGIRLQNFEVCYIRCNLRYFSLQIRNASAAPRMRKIAYLFINMIYFKILKTQVVSIPLGYIFIHQNLIFHQSVPLTVLSFIQINSVEWYLDRRPVCLPVHWSVGRSHHSSFQSLIRLSGQFLNHFVVCFTLLSFLFAPKS